MRPGDVVADLGSGTGILGLMALRAGAARVYSIESEGIIDLARRIARTNQMQDKIVFLNGLSTRVALPEKVDVVLGDHTGRFGFETGLLRDYRDARERFLKPGGKLIPSAVTFWLAPVEHGEQWAQVEFWKRKPAGFDFAPARDLAANTVYPLRLEKEHLLAAPQSALTLNLYQADTTGFEMTARFMVERAGTLHGIGGWCTARLSGSSELTTSPLAPDRIARRNAFFPAQQPVELSARDEVRAKIHVLPEEFVVTWSAEVWSEKPAERKCRFTHSTFHGMLMPEEQLTRTKPGFIPRMNKWGEARISVLRLCDGRRQLSEIEDEIFRLHPDLFRSRQEAASFVAEVVTRYSL